MPINCSRGIPGPAPQRALFQSRYGAKQQLIPEIPGLTLSACYRSAAELQRDYYNVIRRQDQLLLYLVDIEAGRVDGVMQSLYVRKTIEEYLDAHGDGAPVSPAFLLRHLTVRNQQESQRGKRCVQGTRLLESPPQEDRYVKEWICNVRAKPSFTGCGEVIINPGKE